MSSQSLEKKENIFPIYNTFLEDSINFKMIVIPFSEFENSKNTFYIYDGTERIEFKERLPLYQDIFLNEFAR
ncbi:MAG: hypothetical protein ACFFEY_03730 [Candidatus Thorarchaeota archaeon]